MRNLLKQKQILKCLLDYGWPPNLVSTFFDHYRHHEYFEEVMLVGSPSFNALWDLAQPLSSKQAKNLLQILLKQLDFPEELSGKDEEVRPTLCHLEELAAVRKSQAISAEPAVCRCL